MSWFSTIFCLILSIFVLDAEKPFNILFVVSDDLRADLGGHYGQNDIIYTPNLDAFQSSGFTFTHAYTQQAVCAATRASFLTGVRPDTTRIWNNGPYFRDRMINNTGKTVITLPEYFKEFGNYYTVGSGKVFHPGKASGGHGQCNLGDDMPYSWNYYWDCSGSVSTAEVQSPAQAGCKNGEGCTQTHECLQCLSSWNCYNFDNVTKDQQLLCPADCNDDCFQDYDVAQQTLKYFADITTNKTLKDKQFFIAAGLRRPHVGFFSPLRYYKQYGYDNNYSGIARAKYTSTPYNMPLKAASNNFSHDVTDQWNDVNPHVYYADYLNPVDGLNYSLRYLNNSFHNHIRGGYYASVAFMDDQFGRIIRGLYEYNLWNNTIVAFVGDHGWHLGEQGMWAKYTNFEVGTRVPLIIRIPGLNEGKKTDVLVEQLDMFPTLIDASGIGFNENITKQLEGKSLLNLIQNPTKFIDYAAYSQFPRGGTAPDFNVMGISMRTTQWRYTEWVGFYAGTNTSAPYPLFNISYGKELYNHSNLTIDENDMNGYDNYNLAYDTNMQSIVNKLHDQLQNTWDNQSWAINKQYSIAEL